MFRRSISLMALGLAASLVGAGVSWAADTPPAKDTAAKEPAKATPVTAPALAKAKAAPAKAAAEEVAVLRALQRDPAARYPNAATMKAELDDAEHVRVTGLAGNLQEPAAWKPNLSQRPGVLAAVLLGPILIAIAVLLFLLLRR